MIYISHTGAGFGLHCSMRGEERRGGILGQRNWGDREKGIERESVCACVFDFSFLIFSVIFRECITDCGTVFIPETQMSHTSCEERSITIFIALLRS